METVKRKRKKVLASGMLVYLCLGFVYAWSNFVPHMEADEGWSRTAIATAFSISMIAFSASCAIAGALAKKYGTTIVIRLGTCLMLLGLIGTGMSKSLPALYAFYGVIYAAGVGSTYVSSIPVVLSWFPDKIGTTSGVLLAIYGLGGAVLGTAAAGVISISSWETAFIIMGSLVSIIVLLCSHYIKVPDDSEKAFLDEIADNVRKTLGSVNSSNLIETPVEMTTRQMLKRKSFWMYFIWFSLGASLWLGAVGEAATFALDIGATAAVATLTSGIITCCNGVGRLITGWLYDHLSRRKIMLGLSSVMLMATLLMLASLHYGIIWLLMLSIGAIGFAYGGTATTNPVFIRKFYGDENYSQNFGMVNFNGPVSAILGSTMGPLIAAHFGNYDIMMVYFAAIMIIAFALQLGIKKP